MNASLNIANDLATFDDVRVVTVRRAATGAERTSPALKCGVTRREAEASGGKYLADDAVFHLPAGDVAPQVGDWIVEADDTRWTILEVRRAALDTRLRCACRRWEIAVGLTERVDIKRAVWTKTASGVPVAEWVDFQRNVAARVQPLGERIEREPNDVRLRATHRVFLPKPIAIDVNCRVVAGGGAYDVLGIDGEERLDGCVTLLLERVR